MIIELDPFSQVLLTIMLITFGVFVLLCVWQWFLDFRQELHYLNSEIRRTHGAEQRYWIEKRKKLWLSILPFIKY